MSLSILSLNMWNNSGPWEQRAREIRRWISRLDPDLIGFQEILVGEGVHQGEELAGDLGYHVDFARADAFWLDASLDVGNAIASRWPFLDREALELSPEGSDPRVALSVTADAPFGPVSLTTTHLEWRMHRGNLRERQVLALSEFVWRRRPRGGFPPILCGDFNARPDTSEIRFLRGLQPLEGRSFFMLDTWEYGGDGGPGITMSHLNDYQTESFPPGFDMRIDYIFVGLVEPGAPGSVESCRVVCDEKRDGVFPSDHFGVYTELRAPAAPHELGKREPA